MSAGGTAIPITASAGGDGDDLREADGATFGDMPV